MKTSIKKLESELYEAREDNHNLRQQVYELQKEEKNDFQKTLRKKEEVIDYMTIANKNLLEIVRWHCNPETAKYPFVPEKGQLDEERLRRGF